MDAEDYLKGFRLSFENAKRILNAAETLETIKEFPIANSLLVLSAEEGMKAFTLLLKFLFPEQSSLEIKKSFEDHKFKLDALRSLSLNFSIFQKFDELYYNPLIENVINHKVDQKKLKEESFEALLEWLNHEAYQDNTDLSRQGEWWKQAKTMKENGFYVGNNGQKWLSPTSIKKNKYVITKKNVTGFLDRIEALYHLDFNAENVKDIFEQFRKKLIEIKSKRV